MMRDLDPIQEIVAVITVVANDNGLSVKLDDSGMTCINFPQKKITISDKSIPKAFRVHPSLMRIFRLALAQHEAQHWGFQRLSVETFTTWVGNRQYPRLAAMAYNIVEDYRVNTWVQETYAYDIGKRITWMLALVLKVWKKQLQKMLRKAVKDNDEAFLNNPVNFVVQASIQCAILGVDVDEFVDEWAMWTGMYPPEGAIKSVRRVCEVTWDAKYRSQDTMMEAWQEVYRVLEAHTRERWEKKDDGTGGVNVVPTVGKEHGENGMDQSKVPVNFGGELELEGKKGEALKEAAKIAKEEDSQGDEHQGHAGKGAGNEVDAPEPDEGAYINLVNRNQPHITKLLNKLKTLMQPVIETQRYQKSGRLMMKQAARFIASRRPMENVYTRKRYTLEEQKVSLALTVDLSGSMNTQDARNVLTTISEVGGQWLNDQDFATFVFGSTFQKIKTFDESYRHTRARIGGVQNLGGTSLSECLACIHRMFHSMGNRTERICIVVSDFWLSDPEETKKVMREMRKDDITFIGVGMCSGDLGQARVFTGENSTYINSIDQLPDLFYDIYRKASMRG